MLEMKNMFKGLVGGLFFLFILSSCESWASLVEGDKEVSKSPPSLKILVAMSAFNFEKEGDKKRIFRKLEKLEPRCFLPIVEALVPLKAGFKLDSLVALYTGLMIEKLEEVEAEDIPRYMKVLRAVVPEPKDAEATLNLLRVFLEQGSVRAAQELVDNAKPLTDLFKTETEGDYRYIRDYKYVVDYLSKVFPEKRATVVEALVPLVKEFEKDYMTALSTGFMIERLGKIDSDRIPGYMELLNIITFNRKNTKSTYKTLKHILPIIYAK